MFESLISNVGFAPFFVGATALATGLTPLGTFVNRKRPIIGTGLKGIGLVAQLVYGLAVSGAASSDTIKAFLIGG